MVIVAVFTVVLAYTARVAWKVGVAYDARVHERPADTAELWDLTRDG